MPAVFSRELSLVIVAGIDEAGLGPVLGPLVVSSAAVELPDGLAGVSMWELLASALSRSPSRRSGKVAIGDSKKLFRRKRNWGSDGEVAAKALEHLERGVLAMLAAGGWKVRSLNDLLGVVAPHQRERLGPYPWYADSNIPLPISIDETDVALAANSISVAMSQAGVRLAGMRCELLLAGEFNQLVNATRNKSTTLFDIASRLLVRLWNGPSEKLNIYVDRQGSRQHYLQALQRVFPDVSFRVIEEDNNRSCYRLGDGNHSGELHFVVEAERQHLPVALASMLSKYLRELFMMMFNRFWATCVPGIKPTAGYYVDGRRFYGEIKPAVRRMGCDEQLLYRCR